eukprot:574461-Prorocentrum_minimum.AAC.3
MWRLCQDRWADGGHGKDALTQDGRQHNGGQQCPAGTGVLPRPDPTMRASQSSMLAPCPAVATVEIALHVNRH